MQNLKELIGNKTLNIEKEFYEHLKDEDFKEIVDQTNLSNKELYKYTSRLEDAKCELKNCKNCSGLSKCKNEVKGYRLTPIKENNTLTFNFLACPYKEDELKKNSYKENIDLFDVPTSLKNARIKDIYIDDKSRVEVLKYIDAYYKNYQKSRMKGLYLHGNFGCGKTYVVAALFNELAKKGHKSIIVYFPEFLRNLKSSFSDEDSLYNEKYNTIKHVELLLIDDIGAENLTSWARDEILGTILQYRMDENLPTFFTSNLSLEELEEHLSLTGGKIEKVKARRIIERIKCLTTDLKIIGANRRKWKIPVDA